MKYFIFRNSTIEPLFSGLEVEFSGYNDISYVPDSAETYIWFYTLPFKQDPKKLSEEIEFYYTNLKFIKSKIPDDKDLFVFTIGSNLNNQLIKADFSLYKSISKYNLDIIELSEKFRNVRVIDFSDFTENYTYENIIDWKFYYISKMQINPKLSTPFKNWFHNQTEAIQFKRKKCIIIDLDNTIWGGILGEDGIDGIQISGDYPGNVYEDFQNYLIQLVNSGIMLAICSKNNESDVIEMWEKNKYVLIKEEYVSAYRINWNNKADNISELINELNIGEDSIVFIDDNPTERELIRQSHPLIEIPDFPSKPYMLPVFMKELTDKYFRIYSITEEDKNKTLQYKANRDRSNFQNKFSDFSEYLKSLEINIKLQKVNAVTIPRVAQMTQKTNQFNLTTKRYNETDIVRFIENGDWVYCIDVTDRFGDNGITGLIIIRLDRNEKSAIIDSFLLSCRILGKGIENVFLKFMLGKLQKSGFRKIYSYYIPTKKNSQVKEFYPQFSFKKIKQKNIESSSGVIHQYSLDLENYHLNIEPYYKITEE